MIISKRFQGFVIGAVIAFVISGCLIALADKTVDSDNDIDYSSRFYKEGLADFLQVQLYMFPFNNTDVVTLEYGGEYKYSTIFINHTVPNPDFYPMRELYNFTMNFGYEMTWQGGNN